MERKLQLIVILVIIFLNAGSIYGQEKLIEKKDFESITKAAKDNLPGKTFRLTTVSETFRERNESPATVIKTIEETIPPDKTRYFYEYKSSFNNEKREIIKIGQKRYRKIDDGNWEETVGEDPKYVVVIKGKTVESETYKYLGKQTLNNQSVRIYEQKKKLSQNLNGNLNKETITTTHWISEKGLLLKTQIEKETETAAGRKGYSIFTAVYEYNPKDLKIEAPIKP